MDEIRRLIKELLNEMEQLTPEYIEEFREEWLAELKNKDLDKEKRMEGFVNAVCDYGKAKKKVVAA